MNPKTSNWAVLAGSVFYIGFLPKIPGTWGSLAALPLIYLTSQFIHPLFGPLLIVVLFAAVTLIAANGIEKELGPDPAECVSDEFAGQAMVFLFIPVYTSWEYNVLVFAAGFFLFRFFDVLKPLGIGAIQNTEGGWGVLLDDIVAGMYAQICLLFIIFVVL
ncbi:phosphatidylglycerophosphatase A [Natronogracilivirga saccharolytica]|uniref:phosphatidylglycerophosphatase A family protein n=1 Tax=Natronogracilivirga saccharolytica TaxID=2812953 RepID=UPI00300C36D6